MQCLSDSTEGERAEAGTDPPCRSSRTWALPTVTILALVNRGVDDLPRPSAVVNLMVTGKCWMRWRGLYGPINPG